MRIFWPTSGLAKRDGLLLGWRKGSTLVGVCIKQESGEIGGSSSHSLHPRRKGNSSDIDLVEIAHVHLASSNVDKKSSEDDKLHIWMDEDALPIACSTPLEVILFTPPDHGRLRFLTLTLPSAGATGRPQPVANTSTNEKIVMEMAKQDSYSPKLRHTADGNGDVQCLEDIIPILNRVQALQAQLRSTSKSSNRSSIGSTLGQALGQKMINAFSVILSPLRLAILVMLAILEYRLEVLGQVLPSLRAQSAFVAQLCLRLHQILESPRRFRNTFKSSEQLETRSSHYMEFWNTVWLVLNDLILGYCARQTITEFAQMFTSAIPQIFSGFMVEKVDASLRWLNQWPVGLKLNTPLSQFYCTSFGLIIKVWGSLLLPILQSYLGSLVWLSAFVSLFGLTFTLAMVQDLLYLLAIHLHICFIITKAICLWQLESLSGLWNLFRGKRWNVLRQRTDSYAYDVDQLFLGTLLFTVSIFLFPTVLVYTVLFTGLRVLSSGADYGISMSITALNAFPLFEILLRVKEPSRLPAGVNFKIRQMSGRNSAAWTEAYRIPYALEIRNSPKSLLDILRRRREVRYGT